MNKTWDKRKGPFMSEFKVFKPRTLVYPFLFLIPALLTLAAFVLGWYGVKGRRQAPAPPATVAAR